MGRSGNEIARRRQGVSFRATVGRGKDFEVSGRESNTMGSEKRMALALGIGSIADIEQEIQADSQGHNRRPICARAGACSKQGINLLHARPTARQERRLPGSRARFDDSQLSTLNSTVPSRSSDSEVLAKRRRRFITLPNVHTRDPGNRSP
jgi:hypothetical protein